MPPEYLPIISDREAFAAVITPQSRAGRIPSFPREVRRWLKAQYTREQWRAIIRQRWKDRRLVKHFARAAAERFDKIVRECLTK